MRVSAYPTVNGGNSPPQWKASAVVDGEELETKESFSTAEEAIAAWLRTFSTAVGFVCIGPDGAFAEEIDENPFGDGRGWEDDRAIEWLDENVPNLTDGKGCWTDEEKVQSLAALLRDCHASGFSSAWDALVGGPLERLCALLGVEFRGAGLIDPGAVCTHVAELVRERDRWMERVRILEADRDAMRGILEGRRT